MRANFLECKLKLDVLILLDRSEHRVQRPWNWDLRPRVAEQWLNADAHPALHSRREMHSATRYSQRQHVQKDNTLRRCQMRLAKGDLLLNIFCILQFKNKFWLLKTFQLLQLQKTMGRLPWTRRLQSRGWNLLAAKRQVLSAIEQRALSKGRTPHDWQRRSGQMLVFENGTTGKILLAGCRGWLSRALHQRTVHRSGRTVSARWQLRLYQWSSALSRSNENVLSTRYNSKLF